MCGIAGILNLSADGLATHSADAALNDMLSALKHRGPDDQGEFRDRDQGIVMGARRLSIVDQTNGGQPISNEDGTVTVAFNGEIYNHETLRTRLEKKGHRFETACDTEVLVHMWEEFGPEMPEHLDGMFAFSIWDETDNTLFLCRDRLGIKPLFIHESTDAVSWASEMAPLLHTGIEASVDPQSLYRFFSFRFTPNPDTLVDSIRKLPPGHSLTIRDGDHTERQYWQLNQDTRPISLNQAASRVRTLMESSIEKRLMGEVPVGAFLSGGLDSSAVVALMAERKSEFPTFSIGFDDGSVDESSASRFVAETFETNHHEVRIDLSSMDMFGEVVRRYGEPLADPAILPTLLLADHASDVTKVVLTGEGADELLGGYDRYRRIPRHQPIFEHVPKSLLAGAEHAGEVLENYRLYFRYLSSLRDPTTATLEAARDYDAPPRSYLSGVEEEPYEDIREVISARKEPLKQLEAFDIEYGLPDKLLYKVDHTTMAASLEARVPYLDHRMVELMAGIPKRTKLDTGSYKPILRRAVEDVVPDRVLERSKHGFNVPFGDWLRQDHDGIHGWLSEEKIDATPYLDSSKIHRIWKKHRHGRADFGMPLWKTLNYVAWYHTHLADR